MKGIIIMARQPNWIKRGYESAEGRYGRGGMRFDENSLKRLTRMFPIGDYPNGIPVEAINEYSTIYLGTDYFQLEVGKDMHNWAEREAEKSGDNTAMNIVFIYGNKAMEWERGYATYIIDLLRKKKIKVDY